MIGMLFLLLNMRLLQGTAENVDDGADGAGDASRLQVATSPTRYVCYSLPLYVARRLC